MESITVLHVYTGPPINTHEEWEKERDSVKWNPLLYYTEYTGVDLL